MIYKETTYIKDSHGNTYVEEEIFKKRKLTDSSFYRLSSSQPSPTIYNGNDIDIDLYLTDFGGEDTYKTYGKIYLTQSGANERLLFSTGIFISYRSSKHEVRIEALKANARLAVSDCYGKLKDPKQDIINSILNDSRLTSEERQNLANEFSSMFSIAEARTFLENSITNYNVPYAPPAYMWSAGFMILLDYNSKTINRYEHRYEYPDNIQYEYEYEYVTPSPN